MLVCVKTENGKLEMMDLPVPEPGPGQIVVKMILSTICGTDMHFLDEIPNEALAIGYPGIVRPEGLPMGHEGVGIVHTVGEGVIGFEPGDRVIASCLTSCGRCTECLHGDYSVCTGGGTMLTGCQAEYFLIPDANISAAKVPDGITDEQAILPTDIMSTGFGAIDRADVGFGDTVAVFAQGPVGLCATAGAAARGCGLIIGVDTIPERLEMAKRLGADVVINPEESDPVAEIMALTNNAGVDVAVEAVGTQATFEACNKVVRRGGTISSVGVYGMTPTVSMPTMSMSFLHRRVVSTLCPSGRDRLEHLLAVLQHRKLDLSVLFTHRMKLADAPSAYDLFRDKTEGVLKIAITP